MAAKRVLQAWIEVCHISFGDREMETNEIYRRMFDVYGEACFSNKKKNVYKLVYHSKL